MVFVNQHWNIHILLCGVLKKYVLVFVSLILIRMSELNNRYWLQIDEFCNSARKNTEKNKGILQLVFLYTNSTMGTTIQTLSRLKNFPQKNTSNKKPSQMQISQHLDFFVICRWSSNKITGNKDPIVVFENP